MENALWLASSKFKQQAFLANYDYISHMVTYNEDIYSDNYLSLPWDTTLKDKAYKRFTNKIF